MAALAPFLACLNPRAKRPVKKELGEHEVE